MAREQTHLVRMYTAQVNLYFVLILNFGKKKRKRKKRRKLAETGSGGLVFNLQAWLFFLIRGKLIPTQELYGDGYRAEEQTRRSVLDTGEPPHHWVS